MKKVLFLLVVLFLIGCDNKSERQITTLEAQVVTLESKVTQLEEENASLKVGLTYAVRQAQGYKAGLELIKGKMESTIREMQPRINTLRQGLRR